MKTRDPRTPPLKIDSFPLAARLKKAVSFKLAILKTMPARNGLEEQASIIETLIVKHCPEAKIEILTRENFLVDSENERSELNKTFDGVIQLTGPAATSVAVGFDFASGLEKAGTPTLTIIQADFECFGDYQSGLIGAAIRWLSIPVKDNETFKTALFNQLFSPLSHTDSAPKKTKQVLASRYFFEGDADALQSAYQSEGLADGLPIIPPTDKRVTAMLRGTSLAPSTIVCATLMPEGRETSIEHVSINAVMAGAEPRHFPAILAAVHLFGGPELYSMLRSVNSFGFAHLYNGPIIDELDIGSGFDALGVGNTANQVIARSIALTLKNCGGYHVGQNASPIMGNAVGIKVFAENESASPWDPFHMSLGYKNTDSTVSIFNGAFSTSGNFYYRDISDLPPVLLTFENPLGALVLVSPTRARKMEDAKLSKEDIIDAIWSNTTQPLVEVQSNGFFPLIKSFAKRDKSLFPQDHFSGDKNKSITVYPRSGIHIVTIGGEGSSLMQVWNSTLSKHASVDEWR